MVVELSFKVFSPTIVNAAKRRGFYYYELFFSLCENIDGFVSADCACALFVR